jgi:type I restriction enzyme S subunit
MLKLTFKQTRAEMMVRIASTLVFNALSKAGHPSAPLSKLSEKPQYGFTASSSTEEIGPKFVRITDLKDGRINWDKVPYCACDQPEKYLLSPGDILFARTGATTGKTHLIRQAPHAVFASYLIRVRAKDRVHPEYLLSFFQSDAYWSQIIEEKKGSAQPNVNGRKLMKIQVPLVDSDIQIAISRFLETVRARQDGSNEQLPELPPPLSEQRRIVARIEELAALIEEAQALRVKAREEAEAVVAAAVIELFTARRDNNWHDYKLGELVTEVRYGTSEKAHDEPTGTPVLRMGNIQNGRLDLTDLKYLHLIDRDREKLSLHLGDVLVNRTNSPELVGKCAVFEEGGEYAFASYLIRLRFDLTKVVPQLVAAYINSPIGRAYMFTHRKQMTGQANVNSKTLRAMPICLPPLEEQQRVVAYLDDLQTQMDELTATQDATQAELDALLPSVLDQAFRGEL